MTNLLGRRELRRRLGPVAWCALEDLVEVAGMDAMGRRVAVTSVRQLAANLGVSKDTSARALRRLRHAGLVEPLSPPRDGSGRFGHATYVVSTSAVEGAPPEATIKRRTRTSVALEQPSLFDGEDVAAGAAEKEQPETRKPEARKPEARKPEARKPETRKPETRKPETRKPETRNADGATRTTEKRSTHWHPAVLLVHRRAPVTPGPGVCPGVE